MDEKTPDPLHSAPPESLARLFGCADEGEVIWRPDELAAIYRHQMSVPVEYDLHALNHNVARRVRTLSDAQGLLVKSFGDLLHHPSPPVELLRLAKDFAKLNRERPDGPLPPDVATVLYFASIAVALLRCARRISRLGDAALREGFTWVRNRTWVDSTMQDLMTEALKALPA